MRDFDASIVMRSEFCAQETCFHILGFIPVATSHTHMARVELTQHQIKHKPEIGEGGGCHRQRLILLTQCNKILSVEVRVVEPSVQYAPCFIKHLSFFCFKITLVACGESNSLRVVGTGIEHGQAAI